MNQLHLTNQRFLQRQICELSDENKHLHFTLNTNLDQLRREQQAYEAASEKLEVLQLQEEKLKMDLLGAQKELAETTDVHLSALQTATNKVEEQATELAKV